MDEFDVKLTPSANLPLDLWVETLRVDGSSAKKE